MKNCLCYQSFCFAGKVVDLPRPKPFRAPEAQSTSTSSQAFIGGCQSFLGGSPAPVGGCQPLVLPSSCAAQQSQPRSSSRMGLLEYDNHYSGYDSYVSSGLPSPTSPHPWGPPQNVPLVRGVGNVVRCAGSREACRLLPLLPPNNTPTVTSQRVLASNIESNHHHRTTANIIKGRPITCTMQKVFK